MIRVILLILILDALSFSYDKFSIIQNYKHKKYRKVCIKNEKISYKIKDENILSLIADSCLKIDYIDPLGNILTHLISTPQYRENASYYATIVLQKKLIYQFMNDNINLTNMRLPRTNYILSIIFENLVNNNYFIINKHDKIIEIDVAHKKYIMWLSKTKPTKVFIKEYKDNVLLKTRWYM